MIVNPSMEMWPSGRRRSPAKGVGGKPSRGFESLRLRHLTLCPFGKPARPVAIHRTAGTGPTVDGAVCGRIYANFCDHGTSLNAQVAAERPKGSFGPLVQAL